MRPVTEPAQPRLSGVNFPGVHVKHQRLAVALIQTRETFARQPGGVQSKIPAAGNRPVDPAARSTEGGNSHNGPAAVCS